MTPKEKATSIMHQMYGTLFHTNAEPAHAKQCALIAVDEIINSALFKWLEDEIYWQEVKQEIENL